MKINPINNITKKALPLAAAAAVGLGALTACSSSKDTNQKTTYIQTEMMKIDNTLDSLKSVRGEGDKAFFDYYEKSKDAIEKTPFNYNKTETGSHSRKGVYAGLGLMLLGVLGVVQAEKHSVRRLQKASIIGIIAGSALGFGSAIVNNINEIKSKKTFENFRVDKLNELQAEKQQYFDTKDLELKK